MRSWAILGGLLLAALSPGAEAQMYKCVDARGVTHYADKPRPGCRGGAVNIKPIPSMSGAEKPAAGADLPSAEQAFRRRQIERMKREETESRERVAREKQCERLKRERYRTEIARRVYATDAQGNTGPIDDAARAQRLVRLDDQIAQACR